MNKKRIDPKLERINKEWPYLTKWQRWKIFLPFWFATIPRVIARRWAEFMWRLWP